MDIFIDTQDMEERYAEELYNEYLEKQNQKLNSTLEEIREYVENTRVDNNYMVQEKYEHILQIIDKGEKL